MRSKMTAYLRFGFLGAYLLVMAACSEGVQPDRSSDYVIGNPLQSMTSLVSANGVESNQVVLFDKMLRRIHQFDLDSMKAVRSFGVRNPSDEHFVLNGKDGRYVIDMSLKSLTVFNHLNQAQQNPLKLQGKPKSAYFDANSGIFLLYDDLQSVGLMSLDPNGEILKTNLLGASVLDNSTASIAAGDIDASGNLIASLTDDTMVVVDTLKTLDGIGTNTKGWFVTDTFSVALTDISWVAPLPKPNLAAHQLVLVRSSDKIAVVDTVDKVIVSSLAITGRVEKLSKQVDPHVILRDDNHVTLVYAKNGVIQTMPLVVPRASGQVNTIMSSTLNLAKDTWSFVDTTENFGGLFNDLDTARTSRRFKRYLVSRHVATHNVAIDNEPQIAIANSFIFALYKDELGYAERIHVSTEEKKTIERFNLRYIPVN